MCSNGCALGQDRWGCDDVKIACRDQGINVSVSRCPSTRIDFEQRGLHEVVRASVHYYNTEEELDSLIYVLAHLDHAT